MICIGQSHMACVLHAAEKGAFSHHTIRSLWEAIQSLELTR